MAARSARVRATSVIGEFNTSLANYRKGRRTSAVQLDLKEYPEVERTHAEQFANLTDSERAAFEELRAYWNEKCAANPETTQLDDYMVLQFLRASPGILKFNVRTAKEAIDAFDSWSREFELDKVTIKDVAKEFKKQAVLPLGTKDRDGNHILYLKSANMVPQETDLKEHVRMIYYSLKYMTEVERSATEGITVLVNLDDWSFDRNFVSTYARPIMEATFRHFPIRVRRIVGVNCPRVFSACWTVIRPFFGDAELKVVFATPSAFQELFPDPAAYPEDLDGTLNVEQRLNNFFAERCEKDQVSFSSLEEM